MSASATPSSFSLACTFVIFFEAASRASADDAAVATDDT